MAAKEALTVQANMGGAPLSNASTPRTNKESIPALSPRGSKVMTPSIIKQAQPLFEQLKDQDGLLPLDSIEQLLAQTSLDISKPDYMQIVKSVAGNATHLTQEQTMAALGIIHSSASLASSSSTTSLGFSPSLAGALTSPGSKQPLKKVLSQNKSYLETGSLSYDEAVVAYLHKLEAHRKKCEADGRYHEARAAAMRLADLKTAQVERLRKDLAANQIRELQTVQQVFDEETKDFTQVWDSRVQEYEQSFSSAVDELRRLQQEQIQQHMEDSQKKQPTKPKPSKEYLDYKAKEASLVKRKEYLKATELASAAEALYATELLAAQQAFEADQRLKLTKIQSRHCQEVEALTQRGARGRAELQLKRRNETERRTNRFRNVVAELESLHRLEIVQLENFLDAQVQAGKASPLKDEGAFRRRRETLYSTMF